MAYLSIPNLPNLTQQEIFNMAYAHVAKNGRKSYNSSSEKCQYGGIGCAASVFLLPEARDAIDSRPESSWECLVYDKKVVSRHSAFIKRIQAAHDNARPDSDYFMDEFTSFMRRIAEEFELDVSIIPTTPVV